MAKRIAEIDLDPSKLSKKEILALSHAGRSFRVVCPLCNQGMLSVINFLNYKNFIVCDECDAVFPKLSGVKPNPDPNSDYLYLDDLLKDGMHGKPEFTEGVIIFDEKTEEDSFS